MRVNRVQPLSLAKIMALMHAVVALIGGFVTVALSPKLPDSFDMPWVRDLGNLWPILFCVVCPVVGMVNGFLQGIVLAVLYNFSAWLVGGVVLEPEMVVATTRASRTEITYEEYIREHPHTGPPT